QFAHALLRRGVMLLQNQIGDGADDAMPGKVPCRGRQRQRARRPDGEACRSNSAFHVRIPSHVASQLYAGRNRAAYGLRKIDSPAAAGRDFRGVSCLRIPAGTDRPPPPPAPPPPRNPPAPLPPPQTS